MRKASPVNRSVLRERISPSSTVMIWERILKGWKWKVLENHFENLGPSSLFSDVVSVGHPGLDLAAERLWLHDQHFITTSNFENWRCEWISSAPPSNRLQQGVRDLFVPPLEHVPRGILRSICSTCTVGSSPPPLWKGDCTDPSWPRTDRSPRRGS